jgi:hypothetical protein
MQPAIGGLKSRLWACPIGQFSDRLRAFLDHYRGSAKGFQDSAEGHF